MIIQMPLFLDLLLFNLYSISLFIVLLGAFCHTRLINTSIHNKRWRVYILFILRFFVEEFAILLDSLFKFIMSRILYS